jgi:microcystin degradation protein MlrC
LDCGRGFIAKARTGGVVTRDAYERIRREILAGLQAALPVDAVLLNLHGAMVADGYDDCEGDLLSFIRARTGPDVPIFAALDLHCHLTRQMVENCTAFVMFKEYPHTDYAERAEEVFELARRTLLGEIRPVMEVADCHMLGLFPTSRQPMRKLVDHLSSLEGKDGILSVSIGHGFPWADVEDVGATVLVVADSDREKASRLARQVAREFFSIREAAQLPWVTLEEAIDRLTQHRGEKPLVLSDIADGGGGGTFDSTFLLRVLLERGVTGTATSIFWDPIALSYCLKAGEGARLRLRLGGKAGHLSGDPLDLDVEVVRIVPDAAQTTPHGTFPFGPAVVLACHGNLIVLSGGVRIKAVDPTAFTCVGIDPGQQRGLILKGQHGFYDAYVNLASDILYVDTPGACQMDPRGLPYRKLARPMWPLVQDPFGDAAT